MTETSSILILAIVGFVLAGIVGENSKFNDKLVQCLNGGAIKEKLVVLNTPGGSIEEGLKEYEKLMSKVTVKDLNDCMKEQ